MWHPWENRKREMEEAVDGRMPEAESPLSCDPREQTNKTNYNVTEHYHVTSKLIPFEASWRLVISTGTQDL